MTTLVRQNSTLFPLLPSLLEDFFNREWADSSLANKAFAATLPAVNVREDNDQFTIEVAAPGMKRDDFKVELDQNVLTILSHKEESQAEQNEITNYTRREFNYQSFQRSFTLPENKVEGEKIAARYIDGILLISVPKKEEAKVKPVKQITVG
ncbi:MAG TPA: Hsp20/alpha crystallin family protein [Cyclobacteriaceae bacterium]|jgi:HSP20 family protein|nr:Hsp20/alpha crystallin family protein [Cyclobacteriaceae bacterium]